MDNYYHKYLKYKQKYLELADTQIAGAGRGNSSRGRGNYSHGRGNSIPCRNDEACENINCTFSHSEISTDFESLYDPKDLANTIKIELQTDIVNIINNNLRYTILENSKESLIYNFTAPNKTISSNERAILLLKKYYINKLNDIIEDIDIDTDFTILYRNIGRDYNSIIPLIRRTDWNETCEFLVTSIITFCQFLILFFQGFIKNVDFIVFTELCYDESYIEIINDLLKKYGYRGYFVSLRRDCKDFRIDDRTHNIRTLTCDKIRSIDKTINDKNYKISGIIYKTKFRLNKTTSLLKLTENCYTNRDQGDITNYSNIYLINHYYFDPNNKDKHVFTECIGQYAQKGIFYYEDAGYAKNINIYNIHISNSSPNLIHNDSFIQKVLNKLLNDTGVETFIIVGDTNCKNISHMNTIIQSYNIMNTKRIKYNMSILDSNLNKCKNCINIFDSIIFHNEIKISDIIDYSSHYYFLSKYKFKTAENIQHGLQQLLTEKNITETLIRNEANTISRETYDMDYEDNYTRFIMNEERQKEEEAERIRENYILANTYTSVETELLQNKINKEDAMNEQLFKQPQKQLP